MLTVRKGDALERLEHLQQQLRTAEVPKKTAFSGTTTLPHTL
jgi:hypothetical protein